MSDFSKEFIKNQKIKLLEAKQKILDGFRKYDEETKSLGQEKPSEEGDLAQVYLDQKLNISFRERDMRTLRQIELALSKIEDKSYGYCEEYGEPIAQKRLEKQPWARLSLQAAEDLEESQKHFRKVI